MKHLEVSGAVRPLYGSLGVKGLMKWCPAHSATDLSLCQRNGSRVMRLFCTKNVLKMKTTFAMLVR